MNNLQHKEFTQENIDLYYFYKQTGIHDGYFERYFFYLKNCKTTFDAFTKTNAEYYELFGANKYSCIRSFRNSLNNFLK